MFPSGLDSNDLGFQVYLKADILYIAVVGSFYFFIEKVDPVIYV